MNRGAFFWGGLLVLLGVLFLLSNLGLLGGINIWSVLGPLILIFIGLWLLLGIVRRPSTQTERVQIPLKDYQSMSLHINHGAGRLKISPGTNPENLLEGSFSGGLVRKESQQDNHLDLTLSIPSHFLYWQFEPTALEWDIHLNPQIHLDLEVNFGAGESRLDLNDLDVGQFVLKTGASDNEIILSRRPGLKRVRIEAGLSAVKIVVPDHVAAKIKTEAGLAGITIDPQRFPRQGGVRQSLNYDQATSQVEIKVTTGLGAIDIR